MNRSFVYGIVVASTTWCFSLYLYWLLTQNSSDDGSTKSFRWSPAADSQQYAVLKHNIQPKGPNQLGGNDKESKTQEQKDYLFKKYKKDKKFREISQRLIDDLKPINEKGGTGKMKATIGECSSIFSLFGFSLVQMKLEWCKMRKSNIYGTLAISGMHSIFWLAAKLV